MMRRILLATVLLVMVPGVAAAGGGGHSSSACPGYAEGDRVTMLDSCFSGVAHFAPDGETITVANNGSLPHTFTAVDGSFDTGQLGSGATAEVSVGRPGVYRVFCVLHGTADGQGMAGVLIVGDPTSAEAAPVSNSSGGASTAADTLPAEPDIDFERPALFGAVALALGLSLVALWRSSIRRVLSE